MKWIIICIIIGLSLSNNFLHKNTSCPDPCESCQRAVYQLKFHKVSNCEGDYYMCKNTCFEIDRLWAENPENLFNAFNDDQVGKCDICFRANFCTFEQCQMQLALEEKQIEEIISKAYFTGKKKNIVKEAKMDIFYLSNDEVTNEQLDKLNQECEDEEKEIKVLLSGSGIIRHPEVIQKRLKSYSSKLEPSELFFTSTDKKTDKITQSDALDLVSSGSNDIISTIDRLLSIGKRQNNSTKALKENFKVLEKKKNDAAALKKVLKARAADNEALLKENNLLNYLEDLEKKFDQSIQKISSNKKVTVKEEESSLMNNKIKNQAKEEKENKTNQKKSKQYKEGRKNISITNTVDELDYKN